MKKDKFIFAALLLFQFRVDVNGISNKKRVCEERIIHFCSENAEQALAKAKKRGVEEEFNYKHEEKHVFFEFIGIAEFIELSLSEEKDVVWHRFIEKVLPMERKYKILLEKEKFSAFKSSKSNIKI